MKIFKFLVLLTMLVSSSVFSQPAPTFPERTIRFVVPFAPGGPADLLARVVAQKLSESVHQTVIVDNKPGGNSVIAALEVANSRPDGYTLLVADMGSVVLNPLLYTTLPYQPKDFEPVTKVSTVPNIIVTNAAGPKTMKALVDLARANPGKLSVGYGSATTQSGVLLLKDSFNLNLIEVPYKGGALVAQGLLSNDVTFTVDASAANLEQIKAGRLFAVANLGSVTVPGLPGLPRVSEMPGAAGFEFSGWNALVAPKGTPPAIINQLNREIVRILAMQDVKDKLIATGIVADSSTPSELREFLDLQSSKWKRLIEKSGIPKIQ